MWRRTWLTGAAQATVALAAKPLPQSQLFERDPEAYWRQLRAEQYLLPEWRAFMNNGSLGPAPRPVVAAMAESAERGATLAEQVYPRWGYERLLEERKELAEFFGCTAEELAITHNATEAMSMVAMGLDLERGDEILTTDQEHTGGIGGWKIREQRHGLKIRQVALPLPPKSQQEVADRIISAITPATKVLSFSGVLTTTGLVLPVAEICKAARAKGVITVVDGAHMHGQIPVNIASLDCDFLAGSPHKWLFAPPGCGLLYIRKAMLPKLWPSVANDGWRSPDLGAERFMQIGTNNRAVIDGLMAGLKFAKAIGPERIYARIHQLGRQALRLAQAMPELPLLTPDDDRQFGGLVSFDLADAKYAKFMQLCRERKIWAYGGKRMRIATHIHTRPQDVELFFETLKDASKS